MIWLPDSDTAMRVAGFACSAGGAVVAIAGTLMMAHSYHPFSHAGFMKRAFRNLAKYALGGGKGRSAVLRATRNTARIAELNPENRAYSLRGLFLIFLGFCLQLVGTVLTYVASPSS